MKVNELRPVLRPVQRISNKVVKELYQQPLKTGCYVTDGSQKLYEGGFPARFVQNHHIELGDFPAELHLHEDDLFLCLEGETYFMVGGRLIDPYPSEKDGRTFLSNKLEGGISVFLKKGDWLHIPAGQPHRHLTPESCRLMVVKVALPAGVKPFVTIQELQEIQK